MSTLQENLASVQTRIAAAAQRAGRDPGEVTLVAVTKGHPVDVLLQAYELGVRQLGENRVEEAEEKVAALPNDVIWHMIGHLQSRKAGRALALFQWIHSVDSLKLAERLDRLAQTDDPPLPILLECNVSGEKAKYGFDADRWTEDKTQRQALWSAVEGCLALPHITIQGLMTMAPIVSEPENARPVFARLRQLRDGLARDFPQTNWRHLSMGMTDDFEIAIEEGATLVRVGRAIFQPEMPPWRK